MDSHSLRRGGQRVFGRLAIVGAAYLSIYSASELRAGEVPADKPTSYPRWWFERGVIRRLNPDGNVAPLWANHDYPVPDDYAVANIGQLKQFAAQAVLELNAKLPNGAGADLNGLIGQWTGGMAGARPRDDYGAVNVGQLKTVGKLVYDRLIAEGFTTAYFWGGSSTDNYAVINLGQLKHAFSFDLSLDSDGDGIPDWWESRHGLNPNDASDASQLSSDGQLTNLQKYQQSLNPSQADTDGDGVPDSVEIANGTNPLQKDAAVVALKVTGFTTP